ncbi:MAG: YebC/PmpR family DNA-binding transcriptional regulator [Myxococcota bacterium]|nr:YebC/PmpR family DNA-binding transcriptional regulator [Myxococcota bacterium]
MAGHSKWANIRHRKGAQDAKRGKIFTKLIKEIVVAVKTGGGPDPEFNPRLRTAIQNAKGQNMPKDNIARAIKKASGAGGEDYKENTFEGYGPDGVAVFVETTTDNTNRTVANVRMYFNKYNGSLGKDGCLQFVFNRKGVFEIAGEGIDEDELTMALIDVGAEDVESDEDVITVYTEMSDFGNVQKKLQEMGIEASSASLRRVPTTMKSIDEKHLPTFLKLIDAIEDDDDVQNVYHNAEVPDELLEKYL